MVEIKNIHGQVIAQVENPEEVVRDIYGNIDTDDLENIEGMSLSIDEPEEYCYNEKEDN